MFLRKILTILCLALLVAAGIGTALYLKRGNPVTIRVPISQEMIDAELARKFPKEKVYLKIIRVTYANPKATLLPVSNRVRISLDAGAEIGVKGFSKTYQGSAAITGTVSPGEPVKANFCARYDPMFSGGCRTTRTGSGDNGDRIVWRS